MTADPAISLVIPARDGAATIRCCLDAVLSIRGAGWLEEIFVVDDSSTDGTDRIVSEYAVTLLRGSGGGAGAARNLGWRAATSPLIWFVDCDCVTEPDALELLLPHLEDERVAGVGGSYGNMRPDSLLACLVHEEIVQRHLAMPRRVDFLATFNVIYRRDVLERLGGFDERYRKAQDAELAFRVIEAGYELAFERRSQVRHFHPVSWRSYLRTQRQQGYWRVWLHMEHSGRGRNSYSGTLDHLQPPLGLLAVAVLPLLLVPGWGWLALVPALLLLLAQVPMTWRLLGRLKRPRFVAFAPMSALRALWRGVGMAQGVIAYGLRRRGAVA